MFLDGRYVDELSPGLDAFGKEAADARVVELDMRESQVDVRGQEIFTADKVTLWEWPRSVTWMRALGESSAATIDGEPITVTKSPTINPLGMLHRNLLSLLVVLLHGFRRRARHTDAHPIKHRRP